MRPDRVRAVTVSVADVTAKTRWIFLEIETEAGLRGVGEATLSGREAAVVDAVRQLVPAVLALGSAGPAELPPLSKTELPDAAAHSAMDQALWDIAAQGRGVRLADALGTTRRDSVPVYANINRRTIDRSPPGFAASARDAIAAGHECFKLAPFDEVTAEIRRAGGSEAAVEPGLRRIAAVRDAIGPDRGLRADCHWRLDEASAERVIAASAELGVDWVECPLPETAEHLEALARLRRSANRRGVRTAGMETGVGIEAFIPFARAGAYDVMMPDVKYLGSLSEIVRLAQILDAGGIAFSPHNPTGPVCHAVSLQICAAVAGLDSLEIQFDETPLFAELAGADLQKVSGGTMPVPADPGLGMALDLTALDRCRSLHWTMTRDGQQSVREGALARRGAPSSGSG